MATLAKGLAVLARSAAAAGDDAVGGGRGAGLSRATARRILRTLTSSAMSRRTGAQFSLAPRILELGFAYLSAQNWIERALPLMKELERAFHESCSAAILQGTEIVYVARIPAGRIMSVALAVGSRLPAFHTSLGRAQLGFLDDAEIWRRLQSLRIEPYTP